MKQGKIIFDKDVKVIGESAFEGLSSLTSITIPKSIQTIEDNAFKNCENLNRIEYKGSYVDWLNIIKSNTSFDNINTNIVECEDREIHITLPNYFYIESLENSNNVDLGNGTWLYAKNSRVEYSIDRVNWNPLNITSYTLNKGDKMYFRCVEGNIEKNNSNAIPLLKPSKTFNVSGDISTVIYGEENVQTIINSYAMGSLFYNTKIVDASKLLLPATTLTSYCYGGMFKNCSSLTTAPELSATILSDHCYSSMFYGCSSLTTVPELPATTLAESCYDDMFGYCDLLTTAPELPATTLAESCYGGMFRDCTSLTTAPELPATTLADYCYSSMFNGCTSLIVTPELPATTLNYKCYYRMFYNCTSLTVAPELPATTLDTFCYNEMFTGCTSLTVAPELPATELTNYCYSDMFSRCTSLTTAPELPATTLAGHCYAYMFQNCTSLTAAPELPAMTLADYCYCRMFYGCSDLNYIKCLATNIPDTSCTLNWLNGVSNTGTFVKHPNMNNWSTDDRGIPKGWEVVNAETS